MSELYKVDSIVEAWVTGVRHLLETSEHKDYNLILDIAKPLAVKREEEAAFKLVDALLSKSGDQKLQTVANTIFPQRLYSRHGALEVYEIYVKKIYPVIRKMPENRWGTYAHRLMHRETSMGCSINPVARIIERVKSESRSNSQKRSRYELNMIDPFIDLNTSDPGLPGDTYSLGGPCLSHLSFKLRQDKTLALTAFYRSHYYVERLLGNLMGLSHLLAFVAKEAEVHPGPLTIISSYAILDTAKGRGITEVCALIDQL